MKKILLSASLLVGALTSINAQVIPDRIAKDFTMTDINGQSHNLYRYLDSGYTVFIDVSATWCGPCWNFHNTHVMDSLQKKYGSNGTVQPKKIKVIFIEGDISTTNADLLGQTSASRGNWVAGSDYTIIDQNNAQTTNLLRDYKVSAFPTILMICPDRIVTESTAGVSSAMGNENYWVTRANGCPRLPSTSVDAKALRDQLDEEFLCNAKPTVTFQNWGTSPITNATLKIYNNNTVVATQNWTGNLASKAFATVPINTGFTMTNMTNYDFEVVVSGDANSSNNKKASFYQGIVQTDAFNMPYKQEFTGLQNLPTKYLFSMSEEDVISTFSGNSSFPIVGPDGVNGNTALSIQINGMPKGSSSKAIFGVNNSNSSGTYLSFDHAYAKMTSSSNDNLEVSVSTDCGASWTKVLTPNANDLKTAPDINTKAFVPGAKDQWKRFNANISTHKSASTWIKFDWIAGSTAVGNYAWLDNINVSQSASVENVILDNSIVLMPNPANSDVTISFDLNKANKVAFQLIDAMGKIVKEIPSKDYHAGNNKVSMNVSNVAAGNYFVKIIAEEGMTTQHLSVVK